MKILLINKNATVEKLVRLSAQRIGLELLAATIATDAAAGDYTWVLVDNESLGDADIGLFRTKFKDAKIGLLHPKNSDRLDGFDLYIEKPFLPTELIDEFNAKLNTAAETDFPPIDDDLGIGGDELLGGDDLAMGVDLGDLDSGGLGDLNFDSADDIGSLGDLTGGTSEPDLADVAVDVGGDLDLGEIAEPTLGESDDELLGDLSSAETDGEVVPLEKLHIPEADLEADLEAEPTLEVEPALEADAPIEAFDDPAVAFGDPVEAFDDPFAASVDDLPYAVEPELSAEPATVDEMANSEAEYLSSVNLSSPESYQSLGDLGDVDLVTDEPLDEFAEPTAADTEDIGDLGDPIEDIAINEEGTEQQMPIFDKDEVEKVKELLTDEMEGADALDGDLNLADLGDGVEPTDDLNLAELGEIVDSSEDLKIELGENSSLLDEEELSDINEANEFDGGDLNADALLDQTEGSAEVEELGEEELSEPEIVLNFDEIPSDPISPDSNAQTLENLDEREVAAALGEELPPLPDEELLSDEEEFAPIAEDVQPDAPLDETPIAPELTDIAPLSPSVAGSNAAQNILSTLSTGTLREILDGMQLTINISFPNKKD
ncbi:hypothetical protein AGMMS50229_00320 [Campylobacterota bacterium]|nr:hypothetical protein AGMMS50229_00320 [Campylobacterota bacterium]